MASGLARVLEELKAAGFAELAMPLRVAGAEFGFEAAAVGTGVSHDLVLIATDAIEHKRLVRLTEGLSRALDHLASSRPITLIYIGDTPQLESQQQLERSARVLVVRTDEPNVAQIRQAISVLLPLTLPAERGHGKDPIGEVLNALGSSATTEHLNLIQAARGGTDAVRKALADYIDDVFDADAEELQAP